MKKLRKQQLKMQERFLGFEKGGGLSAVKLIYVPVSIIVGIIAGLIVGYILVKFFKKFHMRDTVKILIILSLSFLLLELQNSLDGIVPISGLLAIMSMGIAIYQKYNLVAKRLSTKYNKLWVAAEVLLFVLVGATVDLKFALQAGALGIAIVLGALVFRILGVYLCLIRTKLTEPVLRTRLVRFYYLI